MASRLPKASESWAIASVDSREVLRALNKLDKEVQADIRARNLRESVDLARDLKRAAYMPNTPPQAELVAESLEPKRDRLIVVKVGGDKQVGRPYKARGRTTKTGRPSNKKIKATAGWLLYGSEHGSSGKPKDRRGRTMGHRFVLRHLSGLWLTGTGQIAKGYWIQPTLEDLGPELAARWSKLCQRAINGLGLD